MQVVILAGGLGTRLKAVAPDTPKAIVPVAGMPFMDHQLALLRANGLTDVLLCIGHFGEKIVAHVGDGSKFGMKVSYVQEDPNALLGTGGALVNALPKLEREFLVMYGDSYLPVDYQDFIAKSRAMKLAAVMSVFRNGGQWDSSNTRIKGDRVIFYSKKAKPGECDFIDYGLIYYRREVIEAYRKQKLPLDMATIQGDLVSVKQMGAWESPVRFYEIGKPEGLAELDAYLRAKNSKDWKQTKARVPKIGKKATKRAAFVDRDGTINEMVYDETHGTMDSPRRPEQVALMKNAAEFLKGLRELGYLIVVVTNQPGVSKGTLTLAELDAVNQRLADLLAPAGWDDLRFCPHHPDFGSVCDCRKPKPGMLTQAARDFGIDLAQSWMIGDGQVDIAAGKAAGCKTVLVSKLKISQVEKFFDTNGTEPDAIAPNLMTALEIIAGRATTKKVRE